MNTYIHNVTNINDKYMLSFRITSPFLPLLPCSSHIIRIIYFAFTKKTRLRDFGEHVYNKSALFLPLFCVLGVHLITAPDMLVDRPRSMLSSATRPCEKVHWLSWANKQWMVSSFLAHRVFTFQFPPFPHNFPPHIVPDKLICLGFPTCLFSKTMWSANFSVINF